MKSIQDLVQALDGIVKKTQIIMDIRLGSHGITAIKVGNSYAIEDDVAEKYILTRKKLHAQKTRKAKRKELSIN
jgi:hypothetical protein